MTTGEPGDVSTRWTAAMICLSTLAAFGRLTRAAAHRPAAVGQRRADARALAGGVLDRQVVVEDEAELEHAEEQHHRDDDDHRELDEALAALARTGDRLHATKRGHRTGSMRMTFVRTNEKLLPRADERPKGRDVVVRVADADADVVDRGVGPAAAAEHVAAAGFGVPVRGPRVGDRPRRQVRHRAGQRCRRGPAEGRDLGGRSTAPRSTSRGRSGPR